MHKKDRDFININDKNHEEFSFVLQEKNEITNSLYNVTYYPLVVYQKEDYYYGAFTNFKKTNNGNLFIVKCKYPKEHSSKFTVYYNVSQQEEKFIEEYLKNEEMIKLIHKYTNMIKKVAKDKDKIIQLDNKVIKLNNGEDIGELQQIIVRYQNIKQQILSYSYLKKMVLSNWDLEISKIISIINNSINNVENKINALKQKKNNNLTAVIIVVFLAFIFIIAIATNDGTNDSGDNGYSTNCYARSDGTRCCTSCKETSYGDIGCGTTCN